jgi:hypothetical protein
MRDIYKTKKQQLFDAFIEKLRAKKHAKGQCPAKGSLQIGMLKDEVRAAWCMPWRVNRLLPETARASPAA